MDWPKRFLTLIGVCLISSLILLKFFAGEAKALQCINGGVTCCPSSQYNPDDRTCPGGQTYPGNCNASCQPTCPSNGFETGVFVDGSCYWGGCNCTPWTNGACDEGSCTSTQRRQYRTCNPNGCSSQTQCVEDPGCGAPSCNATAPSNLSAARALPAGATLTWSPGASGTKQMLYVGAGKTEVEGGCPGLSSPACVVKEENLPASQNSYATGQILSAGETYYFRVVNYESGSCPILSAIQPFLSSCELSPSSSVLTVGGSATLTASVYSSAEIQRTDFSRDSFAVRINPSNDTSYVFQTEVTGESPTGGTPAIITGDVYFQGGGVPECSDTSSVTVLPPGPWWQVVDGDVETNGGLSSDVPDGLYFDLAGSGGFPGVVKYGETTNVTGANVSDKGWLANSSYNPPNGFQNYAYFRRKVPEETTINSVSGTTFVQNGVQSADGNFWYEYDGSLTGGLPLTISSAINLGGGVKVVLLVTGVDLNIENSINFTSGQDLFVALVNGNININSSVGNLMGYYLADGIFSTGASSNPFYLKGSVAALGGINLQRDLGGSLNETTAAEVFEYDPVSIFLFPSKLSVEKTRWKEVAP